MNLQDLLKTVLYTEGEDRVVLAKKSLDRALQELERFDVPKDAYGLFAISLVKLFVRADRMISFEDYSFISEVLNLQLSMQDFVEKMKDRSDEVRAATLDNVIDRFSPEGKEALCTFGLCVLESDDVLTREEQSLFERLLN